MNTQIDSSIGDLIEPGPIGFSFAAPGWTIILLLLLLIAAGFGLWKLYIYKKNKYRRVAIEDLGKINVYQDKPEDSIIKTVSTVKRVAITAYGRENVASIYGIQFMQFLQSKIPEFSFSKDTEAVYKNHLYEGKTIKISLEKLEIFYNESINWIKQHRV